VIIFTANGRADRHSVWYQKNPEGFLVADLMCVSCHLLDVAERRPTNGRGDHVQWSARPLHAPVPRVRATIY